MIWLNDKQKHYIYCYNATSKAPKPLRLLWGLFVLIGVSFYKEIIHDYLLKRGTPDIYDVLANYQGVKDCVLGNIRKF